MLTSIPYGSFSNYSPRGSSELSQISRNICGNIKAGRPQLIKEACGILRKPQAQVLAPFLNSEVVLVPVPRSAILPKGALWPSKVIADILVEEGFGKEVYSCLKRVSAVRKSSSLFSADTRPSVQEHYDSLAVKPELLNPDQITLVDDVLTMGRTSFACALRLHEFFPDAEIRLFAMVRTQGFQNEIEKIVDPFAGEIIYYPNSGKTWRED